MACANGGLTFEPQPQQRDRLFTQFGFRPVFLAGCDQLADAVQDMTVAQLFQLADTGLEKFIEGHPGAFLDDLAIDREAALEEKPHIVDVAAGPANALVHSHQFVREQIFRNHHKHGNTQIGLDFIPGAKLPPVDLHLDMARRILVGKHNEDAKALAIRFPDRPVFSDDIRNTLEHDLLLGLVQQVEVEIDRKTVQPVEYQGGSPTLEPQERGDGRVRVNVLEDLEENGFVGGYIQLHSLLLVRTGHSMMQSMDTLCHASVVIDRKDLEHLVPVQTVEVVEMILGVEVERIQESPLFGGE